MRRRLQAEKVRVREEAVLMAEQEALDRERRLEALRSLVRVCYLLLVVSIRKKAGVCMDVMGPLASADAIMCCILLMKRRYFNLTYCFYACCFFSLQTTLSMTLHRLKLKEIQLACSSPPMQRASPRYEN